MLFGRYFLRDDNFHVSHILADWLKKHQNKYNILTLDLKYLVDDLKHPPKLESTKLHTFLHQNCKIEYLPYGI